MWKALAADARHDPWGCLHGRHAMPSTTSSSEDVLDSQAFFFCVALLLDDIDLPAYFGNECIYATWEFPK